MQAIYFDNPDQICDCPVTMDHLEIEVKFFVSGFEALRGRLQDLGARCVDPDTPEYNVRYDTPDERFLETNSLLRLRKARGTTLTFKSPPATVDDRFKTHRELEVKVDDFYTLDAILQALGFLRRQVYEKRRETWQANHALICMDTMPFGHFLEIEGPPDAILTMVDKLGLSWHRRILDNYLGIFERLQEQEGLPFSDVTFDHFRHVNIDFNRYRHLFEAGDAPQSQP